MSAVKIIVWEEDGGWLGYLQDYPDYWTQGETLEDLKDHLTELYDDVNQAAFGAAVNSVRSKRDAR